MVTRAGFGGREIFEGIIERKCSRLDIDPPLCENFSLDVWAPLSNAKPYCNLLNFRAIDMAGSSKTL